MANFWSRLEEYIPSDSQRLFPQDAFENKIKRGIEPTWFSFKVIQAKEGRSWSKEIAFHLP